MRDPGVRDLINELSMLIALPALAAGPVGKAEHDKQRAVQVPGCFRVNAADHPPDAIPR